jgi:hypothetical protein
MWNSGAMLYLKLLFYFNENTQIPITQGKKHIGQDLSGVKVKLIVILSLGIMGVFCTFFSF